MGTGGRSGGGGSAAALGSGEFGENQNGINAQSILGGNYLNRIPVTQRDMRNHVMGNVEVAGAVVDRVNKARRDGQITEKVTYRTQRRPHAVSPAGTTTGPGESFITTIKVGSGTTLRVVTSQCRGGPVSTRASVVAGGRTSRTLTLGSNGSSKALDRRTMANYLLSRVGG